MYENGVEQTQQTPQELQALPMISHSFIHADGIK